MERDDLAPTHPLAARDRVTRHVMVGFSDPAVRPLPPEKHAVGGHLTPAPRLALDAGDGGKPMHWGLTLLVVLVVMFLVQVAAEVIQCNFSWTDRLRNGMSVIVIVG